MDSSADFTNGGRGFEQGDLVPGLGEAVGCGETAKTASDDDDVKRAGGRATFEECGGLWGRGGISALRRMRG